MASASSPDTAEAALARARELYLARRFADGEGVTAAALRAFPDTAELWNLHGAFLRQLRRPQDALVAFGRALALKPDYVGALANSGWVRLDLGDAAGAEAVFAGLTATEPQNAGHRAAHGRALLKLGRDAEALAELRAATALDPVLASGWLQLADATQQLEGPGAALAVIETGLASAPESLPLVEAKATLLAAIGDPERTEAFVRGVVAAHPNLAWAQAQLGDLEYDRDPEAGDRRLQRACELDPGSPGPLLVRLQRLSRASGPEEGRKLDEAYELARRAMRLGPLNPNQVKALRDVFSRVCDFEALRRLGDFRTLGRLWAGAGVHAALFRHLPRVESHADRFELLEQHRIAGAAMTAEAERRPIRRPAPRPPARPIRLGFLSSDLRRHPVGYFVEPLFANLDPARFELFVYGFDDDPPDDLSAAFEARAAVFRQAPRASAREMAQVIAADDLDVLIELGGSTHKNRLEVMAYRPAPRQLSWLGYPHSAGLAAIDGLITDPWNTPPDPSLLLEAPLVMPRTWIALSPAIFDDAVAIDPVLPEARHGVLTFGTANNPYKFNPRTLRTWAEVTAAVAGARFAFIRPEAASAAFRTHVSAAFQEAGVAAERLVFHPVRGAHLAHYNEIDISLDAFPLTGGTTTLEALWMGVPVVSLKGEAFYERLSWSILANAGLGDLVADDLDGFRRIALQLAADRARRSELRNTMRARLRASPLGDAAGFARDFYDLIERTVSGERP